MSAMEAVFNGRTMTRHEVEIAREAYEQGAVYWSDKNVEAIRRSACNKYPLPTVTRRRVVADPHSPQCDWKVICGNLTLRCGSLPANGTFQNYPRPGEGVMPTPERCKLWAELLETPNETVDA